MRDTTTMGLSSGWSLAAVDWMEKGVVAPAKNHGKCREKFLLLSDFV
jgi:hypothetical protein